MRFYTRILVLTSLLSLLARSPARAQTVPSTLKIGDVFSTAVAGRADLTLDFTDRDYELILYALKTTSDTTKTFAFSVSPPAAAKVAFTRALKGTAPDGRDRAEAELRAEERRLAEILRRNPFVAPKPVATQAPAVGSARSFVFRKFGGVKQDVTISSRLVAVSGKTLAYVDVDTTGLKGKMVTTAQIQAMLEEFDRSTYPLVTSVFGRESDVDGDGRLLFLFTPLVNQVGGISGFYSPSSVVPRAQGGNGNLSDMMYLSPDRTPSFYRPLLAHEFQHLINFNQHVLVRSGGDAEESWLNEALSHVTEDLVGDHVAGSNNLLMETFLAHPERFNLTGDALLNLGVRGAAYLFVRGLTDQKGQVVLSSLTQTGKAGAVNVAAVAGQPFADLYQQWAARLFLTGTKLNADPAYTYAFPYLTEPTTGSRAIPPPREDALTPGGTPLSGALRQTGLTFIRLTGSGPSVKIQVSADAEGDVRALVIPAPKAFRPQLVAPVDFFEFLKLDAPLSSAQTAGAGFTISGSVSDPTVSKVMFRFARTDGPDSLKFIADVVNGRFSRPVVFAPSQAGTYVLAPFLLRGGPLFDGTNNFGPVLVSRGLTDDVVLPADYFKGITFDAPFSATPTAGVGFRLSGSVADPTASRMLVGFAPDRGDGIQFALDVQGGRFSQDIVFSPEQAGTYKMSFYLGQKGASSFPYVDGFEPVTVKAVPGIKTMIPTGYFSGLTLDAPFPADVFIGKAARFSGAVTNAANTQVAVDFKSLDGGQDVATAFINVTSGRFSRDFSFTQAGRFSMVVYLGVQGKSLPYVGQFDGIRVRLGQADIAVTVPRLDFGEVGAGGSKEQVLTLYNRGTQALTVRDVTASSSLLSATPRTATVAAGDSLRVTVTFHPVTSGDLIGTLTVLSDDPDEGSLSVSVVGRGLAQTVRRPSLAFSPDTLKFGEVKVGSDSSRAVVLRNTGNDTLVITGVRFSGPFGAVLPAVIPLFRLAPGAEATVRVTFRPTVAGDTTGTMTVASNDPDRPERVVALRGRGFGGSVGPSIAVSPEVMIWEAIFGGSSSQAVFLWNVGRDTLVINNIRFSGPFGATLPASIPLFRLAPRDSAVVAVTFRPSAPGDVTGTMTVTSNDPGRPELVVSLKGHTFLAPIASITPSELAFDSVRVGNVSRKTLTVSNAGSDTLRVWGVAVMGDSVQFSVSPPVFLVAPGGRQEVTVTFAPGWAGRKAATLIFMGNAGWSTVSLSGTGFGPGGRPSIVFSPTTLDFPFGAGVVGVSFNWTVILWNIGSDTLVISNIRLTGSLKATLPASTPLFRIAPRDSAVVAVTFRPSAFSDTTGAMTVTSNDPGRPEVIISLRARSTSGPIVFVAPSELAFDSVRVGNVSRKTLTVSNVGNDTLRVWGVAVKGDSVHFSVSPPVFLVAPGGGRQEVTVTFAPGSGGKKSATLTFMNNAMWSTVSLSGTGVGVSPPTTRVGDFNGDGKVDFDDFFMFANVFGTERGKPGYGVKYDLDSDGAIGFNDFFIFADRFGK